MGKRNEALKAYKIGLEKTKGDKTLEKKYLRMKESMNSSMLPTEALTRSLMNPEILEWYTNDLEFKKKVDSMLNGMPNQKELQIILKDKKMIKFLSHAGLFGKNTLDETIEKNKK